MAPLGPLAGVWIVKGNLNFSYTLEVLPLAERHAADVFSAPLSAAPPDVVAAFDPAPATTAATDR